MRWKTLSNRCVPDAGHCATAYRPLTWFACLAVMAVCALVVDHPAQALEYHVSGELSVWSSESYDDGDWRNLTGGRYIPRFEIRRDLDHNRFIDADFSIDGYWQHDDRPEEGGHSIIQDIDPYRATLRYATAQTESRVGLQKINFGPARVLRSLRWFDRIDPTDPQQLTDGVWAGLWRYNTLNNANLWLWCLYGNDDPKGHETLAGVSDQPEWGGRFQYPMPYGEVAVSAHTRRVDGDRLNIGDFRENRFALDGSWDIKIGFWVEAVAQQQLASEIEDDWTQMMTLGADYTFGIGNGLHLLAEHWLTARGREVHQWEDKVQTTAVSMDYPVSIIDSVSAIGTYFWEERVYSHYMSWERTYDNVVLNLSGFYYPDVGAGVSGLRQDGQVRGYGVQLLFIYHH